MLASVTESAGFYLSIGVAVPNRATNAINKEFLNIFNL